MKVTKYPQSCLLLEKQGKRIVIDPGNFFTAEYGRDELGKVEAVLYTHQHADHFDSELAKMFKDEGLPLYGNEAVCQLLGGVCNLANGSGFGIAGFEIMPHDLPHARMPDGSDGPPNTGYVVDGIFFHPGDGIETGGLQVANMGLPIIGPDISYLDAINFAKSLGANKVIPMHYDSFKLDPSSFADYAARGGLKAEVVLLEDGQSAEL